MPDPVDPAQAPEPAEIVARRRLLSRGVAAAGAAAGAVALGVAGTQPAAATVNQALNQGVTNTGSTTTLALSTASATKAPLALTNGSGPALHLNSVGEEFTGTLAAGDLLADSYGLVTGVLALDGTTFADTVSTVGDFDQVPVVEAVSSSRLVDTRYSDQRVNIVGSSSGAFDSSGKLKPGAYLDLKVDDADNEDYTTSAVFLNITSTGATTNGYLFAYPPGDRVPGSTTQYQKGVTTASSALVAVGVSGSDYVVRVYSSSTTHVIIDVTGYVSSGQPGPAASATKRSATRKSPARRIKTATRRRR